LRILQNSLSAETKLTETGAFENANGDVDDGDDDYEDLLASIVELFLTLKNGDGLNVNSECFDIQFGNKPMETTSLSTMELENAIELIHLEDNNKEDIQKKPFPTERFCATTNNLNTLALRTRITRTQANTER
jgi:hypothetical protein